MPMPKFLVLAAATLALAPAVQAQDIAAPPSHLKQVADSFLGCLRSTVQSGMEAGTDPAKFKASFAEACMSEQTAFRTAAVAQLVSRGKTEAQAETEIDSNIARGRAAFAADQQKFIEQGKAAETVGR